MKPVLTPGGSPMPRLHSLLLCVVLVGLCGPAVACLNDNETSTHEREFRSQYGGLASLRSMSMDEFAYRRPVSHSRLIAGGLLLLIGAFGLAAKRTRTRT